MVPIEEYKFMNKYDTQSLSCQSQHIHCVPMTTHLSLRYFSYARSFELVCLSVLRTISSNLYRIDWIPDTSSIFTQPMATDLRLSLFLVLFETWWISIQHLVEKRNEIKSKTLNLVKIQIFFYFFANIETTRKYGIW